MSLLLSTLMWLTLLTHLTLLLFTALTDARRYRTISPNAALPFLRTSSENYDVPSTQLLPVVASASTAPNPRVVLWKQIAETTYPRGISTGVQLLRQGKRRPSKTEQGASAILLLKSPPANSTTSMPPLTLPIACEATRTSNNRTRRRCSSSTDITASLEEYKPYLSEELFHRLQVIHANKSLSVVARLQALDTMFMSLPEKTLALLPIPRAFRRLPADVQDRVHAIYYSKSYASFEEKLRRIEELIHSLPRALVKRIPVHSDLPALVEFDVPVLLQFNGQIVLGEFQQTHRLQSYMSDEDFELLAKLLARKNIPEVTRARLIGKLLKSAYQKDPLNFPLPLGEGSSSGSDSSAETPEEVRRLGVHLMFAQNPFDHIDPFSKALEFMKLGQATHNGSSKAEKTGAGDDNKKGSGEQNMLAKLHYSLPPQEPSWERSYFGRRSREYHKQKMPTSTKYDTSSTASSTAEEYGNTPRRWDHQQELPSPMKKRLPIGRLGRH